MTYKEKLELDKAKLERRDKYLFEEVKVVQGIINRMADNSFKIKTWTVTLVVATLLIKGKELNDCIAFLPILAFWFLDGYYLYQERLFREQYKWITSYRLENDDKLFFINPIKFKNNIDSIFSIMFSISILPFYGMLFSLLSIKIIFLNNINCILKTCENILELF
jgi:hypothetical protein